MINKYDNYLQELHDRDYTIYNDNEAVKLALQELHDNSYLIFDKEETLKLKIEYEDEFNRLSHKVSFVSLQTMDNKTCIFESKPNIIVKEKEAEVKEKEAEIEEKIEEEKKTEKTVKKYPFHKTLAEYDYNTHLFFIRKEPDVDNICDATGHYDPVSKSFILHKDSILSIDVTSELRYSAQDVQRRFFIKKNCIKKTNGYNLLHDTASNTPDQAALYVLGCKVNGLKEWIDSYGKTLDEVFYK